MSNLTLVPDCIADIIILALIICIYFDKSGHTYFKEDQPFQNCLHLSFININVHLFAMVYIVYADKVSPTIGIFALTFDLVLGGLVSTLVFRYIIFLLHQNSDKSYLRLSLNLLFGVSIFYLAIVLLNLKTGWIFSFDTSGTYIAGKLEGILTFLYLTHILFTLSSFRIFKMHAYRAIYRLGTVSIPIFVGAVILQFIFPSMAFNAIYGMLAVVIIFICVQQNTNELDSMTALYTRPMLSSFLEFSIKKKQKLHILAIKLDQFQQISTRFGAENGDRILKEIARYLQQTYPKYSYRMKGVTFILVFPDSKEEEYQENLVQLMERFKEPWKISGDVETVVRAGFADLVWTGEDNTNVSMLLANIEYALNILKNDRELNYIRFGKSLQEAYDRRDHIIQRLKTAQSEKDSFRFTFQPIFTVAPDTEQKENATNWPQFAGAGLYASKGNSPFKCVGAEALLRLNDIDGTPLSPGEFIPIAESTGQIYEISYMTLKMACDFLNQNILPENWFITLNISAHQFVNKHFIQTVIDTLETYDIKPGRLKLEITEYTSLVNADAAMDHISALHRYGVGVFLDDFGVGYSNLFAASHLPLECVKIDKSLMKDVQSGTAAHRMLQAFISGFAEFKIPVLVEGVEEKWQSQVAHEMGAAMMQGYYMSHPLEESDFIRWVKTMK